MKNRNFQYKDKHKINVYLDKKLLQEIRAYHITSGITLIKLYNEIIKNGWSSYKVLNHVS